MIDVYHQSTEMINLLFRERKNSKNRWNEGIEEVSSDIERHLSKLQKK